MAKVVSLAQLVWVKNNGSSTVASTYLNSSRIPQACAIRIFLGEQCLAAYDDNGSAGTWCSAFRCSKYSLNAWLATIEGITERAVLSMLDNSHSLATSLKTALDWYSLPTVGIWPPSGSLSPVPYTVRDQILGNTTPPNQRTVGIDPAIAVIQFNKGDQQLTSSGPSYGIIYPPIMNIFGFAIDTTVSAHSAGQGNMIPEIRLSSEITDPATFIALLCSSDRGIGLKYYPPNKPGVYSYRNDHNVLVDDGYQWDLASTIWQKFGAVPEGPNPLGNPFATATNNIATDPVDFLLLSSFGTTLQSAQMIYPDIMQQLADMMRGDWFYTYAPYRMNGVVWAAINAAVARMAYSTPYTIEPGTYPARDVFKGLGFECYKASRHLAATVVWDKDEQDFVIKSFNANNAYWSRADARRYDQKPIYYFREYATAIGERLARYNYFPIQDIIAAYYECKNGNTALMEHWKTYYDMFLPTPRADGPTGVAHRAQMNVMTMIAALKSLDDFNPPYGWRNIKNRHLNNPGDIVTKSDGFGVISHTFEAQWCEPYTYSSSLFDFGFPCDAARNKGYVSYEYLHALYKANVKTYAKTGGAGDVTAYDQDVHGSHGCQVGFTHNAEAKVEAWNKIFNGTSTTDTNCVVEQMKSLLRLRKPTDRSIVVDKDAIPRYMNYGSNGSIHFPSTSMLAVSIVKSLWAQIEADGWQAAVDILDFWCDLVTAPSQAHPFEDGIYLHNQQTKANFNEEHNGYAIEQMGGDFPVDEVEEMFGCPAKHLASWEVNFNTLLYVGAVDWAWKGLSLTN